MVLNVGSPCQLQGVGLCGTEGCLTTELGGVGWGVGVGMVCGDVWTGHVQYRLPFHLLGGRFTECVSQ